MLWIHCVYFGGGVLGREISAPHSPGELKKVTGGSDVCDMSTQDPQAFTVPPILGECLGRGPLLVHSSSTARVGSSPSAAYGEGPACIDRGPRHRWACSLISHTCGSAKKRCLLSPPTPHLCVPRFCGGCFHEEMQFVWLLFLLLLTWWGG